MKMIETPQGKRRKRRGLESTTSPRRIEAQQRAAKAIELRKAGMTYEQIAETLGYSHFSTARNAVARALEIAVTEPAQELIQLETMRLDALFMAVWPDARRGVLKAVDRALKIQERRAKLLGLDKPAKFEGEVNGTGGMLIIPATVSMDDWERMAAAHCQGKDPGPIPADQLEGD